MLFDPLGFLFLRCSISVDNQGYMVEKEFFLGLPESTDQSYLWRILADPRFAGNPPSLTVERSDNHPVKWNGFFWIKLEAGKGFVSGPWNLHSEGIADINRTIGDACAMHEQSMVEGFHSLQDVERFLETAYRSFECY